MTQALSFPLPASLGNLDAYIQSVKALPLLSQAEETDLARQLKYENNLDAAKKLILSHLRVVVSVARGYIGYGLPQADLIQEGNIGLMKAVRRFDPERGVRLVSFAIHWIRAEMHEYVLRNWRLVKVATTKAQRKLFFNLRSMKEGHGPMSADEVTRMAKELGVKREDVTEMETRLDGYDFSLEPTDDEDNAYAPIAYLTSNALTPDRQLEFKQTQQLQDNVLQEAMQSLDERSRRIIEARWLKEDDTATLHELAAEYGVSAERIRQIEQKAFQKMRGHLQGSLD